MDQLQQLNDLQQLLQIPQRILRDRNNPMEEFDDNDFMRRFRFRKDDVLHVLLPMVSEILEPKSASGCPLPPMLQLTCALRYFATGSFQIVTADTIGVHQCTVSRVVKKVALALCTHFQNNVKFPTNLTGVKQQFAAYKGFPGVIGCIDCTHIPIQSPKRENGEWYRNRKGWFSLNIQAVCGPNYMIYDLITRWPGSAHDSRIFDNSGVKLRLENNALKGLLLGDSGYAQTRYVFTPLQNPVTQAELRYNRAQIATRGFIERTFGIWKRRFACLSKKSALQVDTMLVVISACAILHNLCIKLKYGVQDFMEAAEPDAVDAVPPVPQNAQGRAIKRAFILRHFNN